MRCAWPDCPYEGDFRAPKDPKNPREWQYFCKEHIKEFNKNWNGLNGFSQEEIISLQSGTTRPTWGMGVNGAKLSASKEKLFADAQDLYSFFQKRVDSEKTRLEDKTNTYSTLHLPPDVKEACVIFNLPQPEMSAQSLKKTYLSLVKQNHPDVNKADDAPERIKKINVAYRILSDYALRQPMAARRAN